MTIQQLEQERAKKLNEADQLIIGSPAWNAKMREVRELTDKIIKAKMEMRQK